jgi:GT2 family glycosyltransferase
VSGPVVVLGMMSKIPVAGVVWQTVHYLAGLRRLGLDVWYVEAHARTPSMLMARDDDDGAVRAATFIDGVMRRFGFRDRWAYHALHEPAQRCFGVEAPRLRRLYGESDVLLNLHGATVPTDDQRAGRLVYLETDPVDVQVEVRDGLAHTLEFLDAHDAHFTFGENYGKPWCGLPVGRFDFRPTRQPVVLDLWRLPAKAHGAYSTIGNWRQPWRVVKLDGEEYHWSKHLEWAKFLDLPARTRLSFELALASYEDGDRRVLEEWGWQVRDAIALSKDPATYRAYIGASRGEFSVAKDQNVRLRTGWFSDRSATYLAAGRPVVVQDTGFGDVLPTGDGLFAVSTVDDAVSALEEIEAGYERHCYAAREVARECFDSDAVLGRLLRDLGIPVSGRRRAGIPSDTDLTPLGRRPTVLHAETTDAVLALGGPGPADSLVEPEATIVVVSYDTLVFTKLCVESVLVNTDAPPYELIVVDNGSHDGSREYLEALAASDPRLLVVASEHNDGFARANNRALEQARGRFLVLLNSDAIVPPGWLGRLLRHLDDSGVGAVGPVTNRIGNEAQVDDAYRTYGEFAKRAAVRATVRAGASFDIPTLTMFCVALRRAVYDEIGPLDERFGIGLLEDDDYSLRLRAAGYRLCCAEDVLVHHFGEASFGKLVPNGARDRILAANKRRFADKWGRPWQPYGRRPSASYDGLAQRVRALAELALPDDARVLVVSRGDDGLLRLTGRQASHFPQAPDGVWAGHYPADSGEAIEALERLRRSGYEFLLIPETSFWWITHYAEFGCHLEHNYRTAVRRDDTCLIVDLRSP